MKYFKRYRTTGEPFFVNESGDYVSEQVALTNLVESSMRVTSVTEFCEQTMFGESAADRKHRSTAPPDRKDPRVAMEEAFRRRIAIASGQHEIRETSQDERGRRSISVSRTQAATAMEEALLRFAPNTARA